MPEQFILPNWHVLALHFPLGLLSLGVVLEWLSHAWPGTGIRTGARWMIMMGALLAVPTATLGIYAFRDVVAPGAAAEGPWYRVAEQSPWTDVQWRYMRNHAWLGAIGGGLSVLVVVWYLACSDEGRRKSYWPGLLLLTVALGLMVTGSWYSGESVYRYGTAVQAAVATQSKQAAAEPLAAEPHGRTQPAGHEHAEAAGHGEHDEPGEEAHETSIPAWVHRYLPPIQLHLLLAGLAVGFAAAAIGLSIRRWSQPAGPLPAGSIPAAAIRVTQAPVAPASAEPSTPPVAPAPATLVPATIQTPVFAARYWLTALILAALTAAVGLWMTGDWRLAALLGPLQHKPINVREDRLFWHVVFGVTIVVSALLLALATRVSARAKFFVGLFILICLAAVALQVWVGVLLLYDGMEGRLTGFVVK